MYTAENYVFASTPEEAASLLRSSANARIIAGGTWLRMTTLRISKAIDISRLGLDKIEEIDGYVRIGAMTSLRAIETSPVLNALYGGVVSRSVSHIVGVQFKNSATIGAGVYSAFGFSDPLCALLACGAEIELALGGRMKLSEYTAVPRTRKNRDVLTYIYIKNAQAKGAWQSFRQTATDFSLLNLCLVKPENEPLRLCVGARPMKAALCEDTARLIESGDTDKALASLDNLTYGSNLRGSAEYRKKVAKALLTDALKTIEEAAK